jgi:hypothetical protein
MGLAAPMILEEDRDSRGSGKSARSSSTLFLSRGESLLIITSQPGGIGA